MISCVELLSDYTKNCHFFFNYLYRYETLVGTIGKKFLKKRDQRVLHDEDEEENSNTKPKKARKMFLKPQD